MGFEAPCPMLGQFRVYGDCACGGDSLASKDAAPEAMQSSTCIKAQGSTHQLIPATCYY